MSERLGGSGRGKRPALQIEDSSPSDSDSDFAVEVILKRKKTNVIESQSSDDSSGDSVIGVRSSKLRRKMPRMRGDNDRNSEESSEESTSEENNDDDDEDDDNEDDDYTVPNRREPTSQHMESEEESSSSASESEDASSESGHSSAYSYESCDNTEEEAMVQAAIQESLASVHQPTQSKPEGNEPPVVNTQPDAGGFTSDSSDGQSEKCPICLISFSTQEIGSPETCDHSFCSLCIQEWAKNVNTCPVDRQAFTLILVRKQINGKVIKKIPVQVREATEPQESDSDPTFCEVCGRSDREDRLLLCDGCDLGYHLECLDPPMENVPVEEWFCPDCASDQNLRLAEEVEMQEGELFDLLDSMVHIRPRRSRLLPRTRQSERVRATIRSLHQETQHQDRDEPALQQPSTSGIESVGADSGSVTSGRFPPSASSVTTVRKRKVVRRKTVRKRRPRRTTKTKRKSVRRKAKVGKKKSVAKGSEGEASEEEEAYTPQTKRRKRRKRKIRRRKKVSHRKAARTAIPRSVKGRLANQLGLCAPKRQGLSLPVVRSRTLASDIDAQRSRAGIPALHIYGPQNELEYFSSDNEESNEGGNVAVISRPRNILADSSRILARKKVLSAAALQSHTAVRCPKPVRSRVQLEDPVATNSSVDLIGSILDSQALWHSKTPSMTIKPDGSLEVNKTCSRPAVANSQGTVVCGSVSGKNKNDCNLIRSDDRLSEVSGSSSSPIDLGSASARTTQTPLYPGRGDNNRPPPNSGFSQFGGNRYSAPNYSNYQGVRDFSNFSSSSNFDANSTRAGYSNFLNSGLPPPPLRNTPVRFRVTPRYPIRRPQGPQRPQDSSKADDKKAEDNVEGNQRNTEEDDEEIDIYSDIEAGGGGSGGPSAGGSEQDETERNMETSYEALPPPPEPSALLMGFGEQILSEEEPTSDSELVIDDNGPSSPQDHNDGPQIPESEKYDPAEPLADSDEDDEPGPSPMNEPNPVPVSAASNETSDDEIPLPPSPPILLPFASTSNVTQHVINPTSNSNASYLHSPTYGETSFETEKMSSVTDNGVVSKVVKEVIQERLRSSPGIIQVGVSSGSPRLPLPAKDDDTDECPNFSIYSAASMDIARRAGQEGTDLKKRDSNNCSIIEGEGNQGCKENEKHNVENIELEDKLNSSVESKSSEISKEIDENLNGTSEKNINQEKSKEENRESEEENKVVKSDECKEDVENKDTQEKELDIVEVEENSMEREVCEDLNSNEDFDEDSECMDKKERDTVDMIKNLEEKSENDDDHNMNTLDLDYNHDQVSCNSALDSKVYADSTFDDDNGAKSSNDTPIDPLSQHSPDVTSNKLKDDEHIESSPILTEDSELCNDHRENRIEKPFDSEDESLVGDVLSVALVSESNPPAPSGLEGLDTETISETEEAINFEDISQDGNDLISGDEDGEISSVKKKKKKRNRRSIDSKIPGDVNRNLNAHREHTPPEEGEIIDDRPKVHDSVKEKKSVEKEKTHLEADTGKVCDENFDISKPKDDDKKKKKKDKRKSSERNVDRPVLSSSENKRRSKEKSRRSEEQNISWKKPSKSTKERNYREAKTGKPEESSKDKDKEDDKETGSKKKKKEKRKDMERYDVRKIVSDKRRRRKDEFGRDLSRDRTLSRSRSRSHRRSRERSRSVSKNRRHRSPARIRRSRSRSRYRSGSRSHRRSRSKSKNRTRRKSKDRTRRSRSKDRSRVRVSRSRSRGRRTRSRSRSHSRSKNKQRLRSRSRSPLKQRERKDRVERSHLNREVQRFHTRRSWSRTWTPSWSRSNSRSLSCSSFSQSRSPSVRHFNRSFSRSFSRSWSRERYERIPLEKTGALSSKTPKKLTVIVSNTKDSQKKEKKKKKEKKNKEALGNAEKRKKRKEKSPAPSKEVFTSGDNILVSVNFNKSKTTNKDVPSALPPLPKDSNKRKRDENFEGEREIGKKVRKEKNKDKSKTVNNEKINPSPLTEKKGKKQIGRGNKNARMAAILKQKPVAIIDLDQSPFREQTPSPRDLIVLSDSEEEARNKVGEREEIAESLSVCRGLRPNSNSPQSPAKGVHTVSTGIVVSRTPESELKLMSAVSSYLNSSTGPKTPPEPQIKFSITTKQPQLRSINNPLQEEDDILPEDVGLDDSDQRIEEEMNRSMVDIVHKGPNTPPEPRGPTTPCSPPTSPDAYDPFDPTKSGTPSPVGPEASMDGLPSPPRTPADEMQLVNAGGPAGRDSPLPIDVEEMLNKNTESRNKSPPMQTTEEVREEPCGSPDRAKPITRETKSPIGISESISLTPKLQSEEIPQASEISEVSKVPHVLPSTISAVPISEVSVKSPERKIGVVITTQPKLLSTPVKTPVFPIPIIKQVSTSQQPLTSTPSHAAPPPLFPSLTPVVNIASMLCAPAGLGLGRPLFSQPTPLSVPSLLQHVTNAASVQVRLPSDKPPISSGPIRSLVQNGEQVPKPQDTSTEVVDMDLDSPYSPGSSEGDDLFDPPADTPSRSSQPVHPSDRSKVGQTAAKGPNKLAVSSNISTHKSPNKSQDKFDSLFGLPGVTTKTATTKTGRTKGHKGTKLKAKHVKGGKKEIAIKMDEDQLQILDELPSSAVELQVKDKFLKKLNRQERVVEEVKLSLKPHYNRKHITKEEYKDILRKSVPKICHNKSGEINPVKIATLVEAYVKKVRYEKKKNASSSSGANSTPAKAKVAKTTKWS